MCLVAYGVAKDATAAGLKTFLENRGINVVDCVNLTTFEFARTHSYKVTIKASEYEKATKPEIWPYRVGVRLFKQFRNKENDKQSSWENQTRNANQSHQAQPQPQFSGQISVPSIGIETSNRFDLLASGGPHQSLVNKH